MHPFKLRRAAVQYHLLLYFRPPSIAIHSGLLTFTSPPLVGRSKRYQTDGRKSTSSALLPIQIVAYFSALDILLHVLIRGSPA